MYKLGNVIMNSIFEILKSCYVGKLITMPDIGAMAFDLLLE